MTLIAPTLQAWFTDRLITQRDSSPQTIAAYRDTLRLLIQFAAEETGKQPCELDIDDLDAPLIGSFLNHLEKDRGNSARTRNARLAAIHSLYKYAALRHPEHLQTIGRVIAIPFKRYERPGLTYLNLDEIKALLAAPDRRERLLALAAEREPLYRQIADLIVPAGPRKSTAQVAQRLAAELGSCWQRGRVDASDRVA